ncbi:MAG: porin [Gammaproteobacteria bacterium]|jgi:phosphate-selective porin OprO/OprP
MKLKLVIFFLLTGCVLTRIALGATSSVTYNKGLFFNYGPDIFTARLGGYFMGDAVNFSSYPDLLTSGTNVWNSRVSLSGSISRDLTYKFSYNLSNSLWKHAYITYNGWHNMYFTIGQFSPNFTLANWASSTDINFLEIALPTQTFDPPYSMGANYGIYNNLLSFNISIFRNGINEKYQGRKPLGNTVRLIYSPAHTNTRVVHLAISNWLQRPDGSNTISFSTVPEATSPHDDQLLNTGTINNVKYYNTTDFEAAGVYNSWCTQAEFLFNKIMRNNGSPNLNFFGSYLTGSYFLTGESRIYVFPSGGFAGITPIHHKYGALQILARVSYLNLSDKMIQGGKETNLTVGLNWYLNKIVMFKFNIIRVFARPAFNGNNVNTTIYAARIQLQT